MLNVALIGAGWHSLTHHAPALQQFGRENPDVIRLAAVCDLDASRRQDARERFGFERGFGAFDEMLSVFQPDAAVVVLPVPAMAATVTTFVDKGVPLLIEKPLGVNMKEARAMQSTAAGAPVMVSLNRRFDPGLRIALQWAARHGGIRTVHGSMLRVNRIEPEFVWSTGVHLLDLLCMIAGPLRAAETGRAVPGGQPGTWRLAGLNSAGGPAVSLEIMPSCGRMEERLRLAGNGFCVDVWTGTNHPWRVEAYREGKLELAEQAPADQPEHVRNGTHGETAAFLTALLEGSPLPSPGINEAMLGSELAWQLHSQQTGDRSGG